MSERVGFQLPGVTDVTPESFNNHMRTIAGEINKLNANLASLRQAPQFTGDLDMGGNRVTNVGRTQKRSDVPSREELENKALFENAGGQHVAHSSLIVHDGIRSKRRAREPDELITLQQAREISSSGADAVVVSQLDQSILGNKVFQRITFPFNTLNLVNGVNSDIILGANATRTTAFRIVGPTLPFQVTGFADGPVGNEGAVDGRLLILYNATNKNMTIVDESTSPGIFPQNRIKTLAGASSSSNITMIGSGMVMFIYDLTSNRWLVLAMNQ